MMGSIAMMDSARVVICIFDFISLFCLWQLSHEEHEEHEGFPEDGCEAAVTFWVRSVSAL
jgi:hypothetical protein